MMNNRSLFLFPLNLFGKKLDNGTPDQYTFFTGKPHVSGFGYSFLFRNYREDLSKWQTQDPMAFVLTEPGYINNDASLNSRLGYPDGWNNFAYVNNGVTNSIDWQGAVQIEVNISGSASGANYKTYADAYDAAYADAGIAAYTAAENLVSLYQAQYPNWTVTATYTFTPIITVTASQDAKFPYTYTVTWTGKVTITLTE